jgi:hypothetical protein
MKKILLVFLPVALVFFATQTTGAEDRLQTCTLTKAFECTSEDGCVEVSLEDMALPNMIKIDLKAKTIKSLDNTVTREPTKIAKITRLKEMTILQGTELRGWSIALGNASKDLMLSVAGDGEGFIVFGSCKKP